MINAEINIPTIVKQSENRNGLYLMISLKNIILHIGKVKDKTIEMGINQIGIQWESTSNGEEIKIPLDSFWIDPFCNL